MTRTAPTVPVPVVRALTGVQRVVTGPRRSAHVADGPLPEPMYVGEGHMHVAGDLDLDCQHGEPGKVDCCHGGHGRHRAGEP